MKCITGKALRNRMLELPFEDRWQTFDSRQALLDHLAGADLTINAMAMDESGTVFDPVNGEQDLQDGFLRHAGRHFAEQPDNIPAIAEQSAELARWGFRLAHGTHALLKRMVADGMVDELSRGQIARSFGNALEQPALSAWFRVLQACGALAVICPPFHRLFVEHAAVSHGTMPDCLLKLDRPAFQGDRSERVRQLLDCVPDDAATVCAQLGLQPD